ncbi:MAG TPA: TetR/AcrR family transcriptional regulator [Actinomycetota bacterium]|nr:TetR/AcrR family transcriptional regulator [Actinomycetota bacterium]
MSAQESKIKRRMRGSERRAQLLNVARRVFGKSGFHSVSMEEVANEAGVTKPILYDHFPSKKELYLALLDADLSVLHEKVRQALNSPIGNRERIRASFQAYFDFVQEEADGFRLLMQETVGAEREFRNRVEQVREQILSEVADLIVRESKGKLQREHAETVALALIGMGETVAQRQLGRSRQVRQEALEVLVRLAWRGITEVTD